MMNTGVPPPKRGVPPPKRGVHTSMTRQGPTQDRSDNGPMSAMRPSALQVGLWVCILVIAVALALADWSRFQIGSHFDDARYIILARSFLAHGPYGMIDVPGLPAPGKYPFGFPLFLVPVMLLAPQALDAFKIVPLLATLGIASVLFWGWRWLFRTLSYWWAVAVTALVALSPISIDDMRRVMSEPLFTLFCLLSIVLAEYYARGGRTRWWSTAMAVALVFTFYTRSVGIVLVACVLLYLLRRCGRAFWRPATLIGVQAGLILALVVTLTPVHVRDLLPLEYASDENARFLVSSAGTMSTGSTTAASASSGDQPSTQPGTQPGVATPVSRDGSLLSRVSSMLPSVLSRLRVIVLFGIRQHLGNDIRIVVMPVGGGESEARLGERFGIPNLPQLTSYLASLLVLVGFVRLVKRETFTLILIFGAVYFLCLFVWVWNDPRLLYPIQVQLHLSFLLALGDGVSALIQVVRQKTTRALMSRSLVLAGVTGLVLVAFLLKTFAGEDSRQHTGDIRLRSAWISANTNVADVIASNSAEIDYLYSGRKIASFAAGFGPASTPAAFLRANHVKYVLIAPLVEWQSSLKPNFDDPTIAMKAALDQLALAGSARLVFQDEPQQISVYRLSESMSAQPAAQPTMPLAGASS